MAHIHLPDGSFALSWVLFWWICALALVGVCLALARRRALDRRKITIAAFVTTASFAIFQVEVPLFGGGVHLNLTPLVGILAGPLLGSFVVLIVNILSAAIGHGGWGLIGANVLVNFSEVAGAWLIYRGMERVASSLFARAGIATFGGLFVGNLVMVAIILVSGIQGVARSTSQLLLGLSLIVAVNMGAAILEAVVTGFILAYIGRTRPDLLEGNRS
jgi:cobalt/nickel transport system permease protein